ncbi:glucose-1-phosphate adenylyltransferase [Piscinibacter sakaiensis]|uniref:glucose-1-phosphate adenylyltransferase n=1 Tax=Piscinibacter sakaiensis TaxID=1547922 RepID=UPI003AAE37CE
MQEAVPSSLNLLQAREPIIHMPAQSGVRQARIFAERSSGQADAAERNELVRATYTLVLAGGRGSRLQELTELESKPAMPFGGQLRIIDFTLSNCINSGLRQISVLTQYKAQSLIRHLSRGWNFLDGCRDEYIDIVPAQQKIGDNWYGGTADAVFQNLDLIKAAGKRYVLVLAGDHVYQMDYGQLIVEHVRRQADATVACTEVDLDKASDFGVMGVDGERRVVSFAEKPAKPKPMPGRSDKVLASMGIYVFDADFLIRELKRDAADPRSRHDFGRDIIPGALSRARVFAHDFADSCRGSVDGSPYWRDVGTLDAYWNANLDLLGPDRTLNLNDADWPIRGAPQALPPPRFESGAGGRSIELCDSIVSAGCIVRGATLRRTMLCQNVEVRSGSLVDHSLLLPGVVVGRRAVVRRAIIDSGCVLPDGIKIGVFPAEDAQRFTVTKGGVVLVTAEMLAGLPQPERCRFTEALACANGTSEAIEA